MKSFGSPERDWPEDHPHENGQYICKCRTCGESFIGHKRRMQCKKCYITALREEIRRKDDALEAATDFIERIKQWGEAYPKHIFTEPTPEQVDDVCKGLGFRIDRISAMVLREVAEPWGKDAAGTLDRIRRELEATDE